MEPAQQGNEQVNQAKLALAAEKDREIANARTEFYIRGICSVATTLALITLGSMAIDGYDFLTPSVTGSILIGGAALLHLIWFFPKKMCTRENWKETTVCLLLIALGIFALLGHIPELGVAIPLLIFGIASYPYIIIADKDFKKHSSHLQNERERLLSEAVKA